ncbi:hypothetical protein M409DRAFT_50793 [Zasmidium cellare ATCC 36951]|uniref:Ataxin-10 homolog n=1 Tax=Zasmidium cellare ATCC 36951 TaxID=1080233 RepID=A0A6A6CYU0_ZASCE|nr:uncharacterized protein M409DRAFT_50793 [Zasmidium cellare ATCC 36951]KAF2171338.1 hypothetical protein M409DRAFT_50793 [Zasmidium cellare ATCC 36951]
MARPSPVKPEAHSLYIRLVLPPYTIHFKSPAYMQPQMLELLDKNVCKATLKTSSSSMVVRRAIGLDPKFWTDFCVLLKAAIPSLERRSFTIWDPSSVDYESTSGALIAGHYPGLWKDLERLNDLVSIARNVMNVGTDVQDLAASFSIEAEIFRLVNCCVKVTARGYDGDAGTGDEEKWQWIVNAYKKLLITSLQFLNNFVAQNEMRKLMLWVSLFDNSTEAVFSPEDVPETSSASLTDVPSNPTSRPIAPLSAEDMLIAFGTNGTQTLDLEGAQPLRDNEPFSDYPLPPEAIEGAEKLEGNGYAFYAKRAVGPCKEDYNIERKRDPTLAEMHLELPRRWAELTDDDHLYWQGLFEDALARYRQELAVYEAKTLAVTEQQPVLRSDVPVAQQTKQVERQIAMLEEQLAGRHNNDNAGLQSSGPTIPGKDGHLAIDSESLQSRPVVPDDIRMLFTADAGTKILESGKAELMKRLEGYEPPPPPDSSLPPSRNADGVSTRPVNIDSTGNPAERTRNMSPTPPPAHQSDPPEEESEEEADEDEEEDYPGSTEDGRGLLTDVPLILGPSEIEVLPMLIMSGMVPPTNLDGYTIEERNTVMNMHTVRTHILLSQSNGRNLLRELLIFVAAWDLREEELYFKFMVKIMEAILKNALMPYAYHAFRDRSRSKDIISPAQAVIMKLLTCIFRGRGEAAKAAVAANAQNKTGAPPQSVTIIGGPVSIAVHPDDRPVIKLPYMPKRVDLHILNFIFTEFRQHIIPQTCALIFLQGQIHAGRASPEDFPLNLWDMERMYEGVYQYLEFFAVLTEEGLWKTILGEWEMASELVTLLRELEGGIPKMGAVVPQMPRRVDKAPHPPLQRALSADAVSTVHHRVPTPSPVSGSGPASTPAPVAVERPFDVDPPHPDPKLPPLPVHPPASANQPPIFEAETPLAYPEDSANATLPSLGAHDLSHDQDEPSDFEWRNLKKLTVLVLSSLIWKNRAVQDQVRRYGGLEALVGCCRHDEHNPYIREHAIMCLRFAVEGCEENAKVIRRMAAKEGAKAIEAGNGTQRPATAKPSVTSTKATESAPPTPGPVNVEDVPREVLDTNGYETFMDGKGQVGLRRKEPAAHGPHAASTASSSKSAATDAGVSKPSHPQPPRLSSTKLTAERAAELMSSALSSLPLGDKLVGADRNKIEALAKLDRAFEGAGAGAGPSGNGKGRK